MSRIPIRIRLTVAFSAIMAVLLAGTAAFVYFQLAANLRETTDEALRSRAEDVSALVRSAGLGRIHDVVERDESFTQVLDPDRGVVYADPARVDEPLLSWDEFGHARERAIFLDRAASAALDDPARLLAVPLEQADAPPLVIVVGTSVDDQEEALASVAILLLVGGPIALLLASLLGYALAAAALRPVEAMRAEAAAISAAEPARRLPVPRARDELGRLAETLNGMLGRLQRALERERTFVADASHELRTPLALLKGELEVALRRPRSVRELEQALRSAARETDRLARLAEDLLVLARSDEGRLPLQREPIDARAVLAAVAERFAGQAQPEGRAISLDTSDGVRLDADRIRLEQAVGNLVANALHHGDGPIRLSAVEGDGRVELHVCDEGRGFPPEFLPKVFERFARADEARTGDGAGLGLTIAAAIARAHGGSAHAANRDGAGADVWLSLPT